MFKVYIIDFVSNSKDLPNAVLPTKFRLIAFCASAGEAWGIAKAELQDHQKKTVIISPDGGPIGGY